MFSKYKKTGAQPVPNSDSKVTNIADAKPALAEAEDQQVASLRRPLKALIGQVAPMDKERKRKERMGEIKVELHKELLENLNLSALEHASEKELRTEISTIASEILEDKGIVLNRDDRMTLNKELYDEVTGLGPLEILLQDDTVNDILVNGPRQIFVERDGNLELTNVTFKDEKHLLRIIDKIVSAVGRRVDESNPYVDARLADGSRFNAMVPPVAVDGSLVSIRKFKKDKLGIDDLVGFGAFTEEMAAYLQAAVSTRLNIIVSGGTGSGKTTALNALSSFIDNDERILTIEDTAELQLQQVHVGRMESRPPNVEGKGEVSPRDCLKNALRMRPDRIIVGETRGEEVIDMLQAMNTGHDGSMTTRQLGPRRHQPPGKHDRHGRYRYATQGDAQPDFIGCEPDCSGFAPAGWQPTHVFDHRNYRHGGRCDLDAGNLQVSACRPDPGQQDYGSFHRHRCAQPFLRTVPHVGL